jgi:uncharacterized protein (DUF1697 family)
VSAHVALLRGINVGGARKLPMKELVALFERAGCADVRTYIQSGNVVFDAKTSAAKGLAKKVSALIRADYDYDVPVLVRTARELRSAAEACPFECVDPKALYIGFMEKKPTKAQLEALDPERSPGDEVAVSGRELFVRYKVGQSKTKLTHAYLERTLGPNTMRNWRTVEKLLDLSGA